MPTSAQTVLLLVASNVFMTFAWYGHLRNLSARPWYIAALASWGIALFEYLLQVPANRIGFRTMSLAQLKILQEVITLSVFVPFAIFYMRQPLNWNFLWAGLCPLASASAPVAGRTSRNLPLATSYQLPARITSWPILLASRSAARFSTPSAIRRWCASTRSREA